MTAKADKNRVKNRTLQREARKLSKERGIKYTTALRVLIEEEKNKDSSERV